MSDTIDSAEVLAARKRLTDAMHAMHTSDVIIVSERLASELEAAWGAYDDAIRRQEWRDLAHRDANV